MAQVAIVGTEGVGKTVLMTMMAWAFKRERDGVRMIPMSRQTSEHVAGVWTILNGGDWPPSTPQGQLLTLHWELHVDGAPVCDLRCLEIAGQDFRRLFAVEEVNKLAELPEQLQRLAEFIQDADIIVFLANLRDFAGESDVQREDENQWALKFAMDWVRRQARPRHCCLVFTQSDQFGELKRQVGGWDKLAEKYLPYVYSAHVSTGVVPVMAVSAVGGTKVVVRDGRPLRVPDGKWLCKGLEKLAKWIGESARDLASPYQLQTVVDGGPLASAPPRGSLEQDIPALSALETMGPVSTRRPRRSNAWYFSFVTAAAAVLLLGLLFAASRKSPQPVPVIVNHSLPFVKDGGGPVAYDDNNPSLNNPLNDWWAVRGNVRNDGADGWVRVHGIARCRSGKTDEDHEDLYLRSGEELGFELDFKDLWFDEHVDVEVTGHVLP
ncbi:MAG: Rab family GTPase [Pirellulales bacterium]